MMWRIAIFVAVLAGAVQAGEPEVKVAAGTLDYENVGENDCAAGAEVPVRFVATDVALDITFQGQVKSINERRGVDVYVNEIPNPDFGNPPDFPDSGFLLDVDVTLCISPFVVVLSSGSWKVWHISGEDDLVAAGKLSSDDHTLFNIGPTLGGAEIADGNMIYFSRLQHHVQKPHNKQFIVFFHGLDFPKLRKENGSLLHIADAAVHINVESEDSLGEGSND